MKRLFIILMVIVLLVAMTIVTNAVFPGDTNNLGAIALELSRAFEAGDMDRANKAFKELTERLPNATLEDLKTPYPSGVYKYALYRELFGYAKNISCVRARIKYSPVSRIL